MMEKQQLKLPAWIAKNIKKHRTSLGEHPGFPPDDETSFDEKIVTDEYNRLVNALMNVYLDDSQTLPNGSYDNKTLSQKLSEYIKEAEELEAKYKGRLETLAENIVNDIFHIPSDAVELQCSLTTDIDVSMRRITPEATTHDSIEFEGIDEIEEIGKDVYKRRFVNAMVIGAAMDISSHIKPYIGEIFEMNPKLPGLYQRIMAINNYLSFVTEDEVALRGLKMAGIVDVHIGSDTEKTLIKAEGVIFPILLMETVKGFMELFAAHGLPEEARRAKYVISKADFLIAEPWDMRLGYPIWSIIQSCCTDGLPSEMIPFLFTELVKPSPDDFNAHMKEILARTRKGKEYLSALLKNIEYELRKDDFDDYVKSQSMDDVPITDSNNDYFSYEEFLTDKE